MYRYSLLGHLAPAVIVISYGVGASRFVSSIENVLHQWGLTGAAEAVSAVSVP